MHRKYNILRTCESNDCSSIKINRKKAYYKWKTALHHGIENENFISRL